MLHPTSTPQSSNGAALVQSLLRDAAASLRSVELLAPMSIECVKPRTHGRRVDLAGAHALGGWGGACLMDGMYSSGVVQDALRQSRLPAVDVGRDADVA